MEGINGNGREDGTFKQPDQNIEQGTNRANELSVPTPTGKKGKQRVDQEVLNARIKDLMGEEKFKLHEKIEEGDSEVLHNPDINVDEIGESYNLSAKFLEFWNSFGSTYFSQSEYHSLAAMFVPEKFIEFASQRRLEILKQYEGQTIDSKLQKIINYKVSESIKEDMTLTFGNLLRKIDEEMPSEFFDDQINKDMWTGIAMAQLRLDGGMASLVRYFELYPPKNEDISFTLVKRRSEKLDEQKKYAKFKKDKDGKYILDNEGNKVLDDPYEKPYSRIQPESEAQIVSLVDYVRQIKIFGKQEFDIRKYLHNVRALSLKGPNEKGYFPALAGYAEQFSGVDIDEMATLPDYDVITSAVQLCTKALQEEFVKSDWKHEPAMFLRERNEIYTRIERRALKQLEIMYADKFKEKDGIELEGGKHSWRLRRAFDMAAGISRGVFLNELEIAAYADPVLTNEGAPRFPSYYTTDPNALIPFDAKHLLGRFQSEGMISGPILFTPIEGTKPGSYDHQKIFTKMNQFFKSFTEGQKAYGTGKGEKLFFDYLSNMGGVGGPEKRGGWRYELGLEGWYVDNKPENGLNHLENVKRIENIGFEALHYYLKDKLKSEFFEGKDFDSKKPSPEIVAKREELFKYLFDSYIKPSHSDQNISFNAFFNEIKNTTTAEAQKKGKEVKSEDFYKAMIERTMYGAIVNRFPSFMIKNQRDRFSEEGVRNWEKMRREMDFSVEKFDVAMQNIGLAETMLRRQISEEMDKSLLENGDLTNVSTKFILKDNLERLLEGKIGGPELNDVKAVYDKMFKTFQTKDFIKYGLSEFASAHKKFPYAVGQEEFDARYITFRGSGGRVLPRALGDIGKIETGVHANLMKFLGSLHNVAIDPKHDFSPLIESIEHIKKEIEGIHGPYAGEKVAANFIRMAITYYRKDTSAKRFMGIGGVGRKNSIAAEMLGTSSKVWEWDAMDIDKFMDAVETKRILRIEPYAYGGGDANTHELEWRSFMGMKFQVPKESNDWKDGTLSQKIRAEFGSNMTGIMEDLAHKYGPALVLFMLFGGALTGYKEFFDKKKK